METKAKEREEDSWKNKRVDKPMNQRKINNRINVIEDTQIKAEKEAHNRLIVHRAATAA